MGTLFDQPVRATLNVAVLENARYHEGSIGKASDYTSSVNDTMVEMKMVAEERGVPVGEVIALYDAMVRNRHCDLLARDGDIKDEQLAGFGELLKEIAANLAQIGQRLEYLYEKD